MNGQIIFADGNGTTIQNGKVTTKDINSGSHQTTTIYCDNIIRHVNPSTANIYTTGLFVLNLNNASFIAGDVNALKYKTQHQSANATQTLFSDYTVCTHLQCDDLACADWTGRYLYTNSVFAYNLDIGNTGLGTTTINSDVCSILYHQIKRLGQEPV
jgi:hypothetical protein